MNQSTIKPIGGVQYSESNMLSKAQSAAQAESAGQVRLPPAHQEKVHAEVKSKLDQQLGSLADISIHFRVDDKTDNVTVFLVDRKTKKVLRAIPSDELQKLQIADLLKLTA